MRDLLNPKVKEKHGEKHGEKPAKLRVRNGKQGTCAPLPDEIRDLAPAPGPGPDLAPAPGPDPDPDPDLALAPGLDPALVHTAPTRYVQGVKKVAVASYAEIEKVSLEGGVITR